MHKGVNEELHIGPSPRARPVADAPIEALLADAEELARRWILTLIATRPLEAVGAMALDDLAREAPQLCAQLVRALGSDAELHLIDRTPQQGARDAPATATRIGLIAGSGREPQDLVRDVEALRGVLWQAAVAELHDAPARLIADLSDRLALACATALGAMLAQLAPALAAPVVRARATARERVLFSAPSAVPGRRGATLIDERADVPAAAGPIAPAAEERGRPAPAASEVLATPHEPAPDRDREREHERRAPPARGRPLPWDIPLAAGSAGTSAARPAGADEPVLRISRSPGVVIDESV